MSSSIPSPAFLPLLSRAVNTLALTSIFRLHKDESFFTEYPEKLPNMLEKGEMRQKEERLYSRMPGGPFIIIFVISFGAFSVSYVLMSCFSLLFGALAATSFLAMLVFSKREREEQQEIRNSVARDLGFCIRDEGNFTLPEPYRNFLFLGNEKLVFRDLDDIMEGSYREHELLLFQFTSGDLEGNKNRSYNYQGTVIIFPLGGTSFPGVVVRPVRLWDPWGTVELPVVSFEDTKFNEKYRVRSGDPDFARKVLHYSVRAMFIESGEISMETSGSALAFYYRKRLNFRRLKGELDMMIRIKERILEQLSGEEKEV